MTLSRRSILYLVSLLVVPVALFRWRTTLKIFFLGDKPFSPSKPSSPTISRKATRSATYSRCLKNFIGATHGRQRPYLIDASHWEEIIADLNLAYQPYLNIVDGTKAMVSGGPWSGAVEKN